MTQQVAQATETLSPLDQLSDLLREDMNAVNAIILDRLQSDVPMIPQIASYLIAAGGKRIRPLLTLACAQICGDNSDNPKKLAAAVEFIHTATLLHDDVVDGSDQRRGKASANSVFGNQASVLVGDFLFARAFELMVETGNIDALHSLSKASRIITEGEVLQMSLIGKTDITRDQYYCVIAAKTAALFAAATEVAPILTNQNPKPFYNYGHALGMAFQIVDDVIDYTSPNMGKDRGDDFMEGKLTLPVILALESASETDKTQFIKMIENPQRDQFDDFYALLEKYNAFEDSIAIAKTYATQAAECFTTQSPIASLLSDLAYSTLDRVS